MLTRGDKGMQRMKFSIKNVEAPEKLKGYVEIFEEILPRLLISAMTRKDYNSDGLKIEHINAEKYCFKVRYVYFECLEYSKVIEAKLVLNVTNKHIIVSVVSMTEKMESDVYRGWSVDII